MSNSQGEIIGRALYGSGHDGGGVVVVVVLVVAVMVLLLQQTPPLPTPFQVTRPQYILIDR